LADVPLICRIPTHLAELPDRAGAAMRHDELIGRDGDVMAATPNRKDRNVA
jgi:hypothetical protein